MRGFRVRGSGFRAGLWWRVAFDFGSLLIVIGLFATDWRLGLVCLGGLLAFEGWLGMRGRIR